MVIILIKRKSKTVYVLIICAFCFAFIVFYFLNYFNLIPKRYYTAQDFNISTVKSNGDFNNNGIDDYSDFILGARQDAENKPRYNGAYFAGGYPPDDIGVCTDVIWRAFKNAGYSLKDMVDADILNRPSAYKRISNPDPNIDFRRVSTLRVFFEKYGQSLTTDITEIEQWQGGDIVIFGEDDHIGIVSDRRNREGHTYIIHNGGQPVREEDYLKRGVVTGHYRFEYESVPKEILTVWE